MQGASNNHGRSKRLSAPGSGDHAGDQPFIVLGDLNDDLETDAAGQTGIDELVEWDEIEDVISRRASDDRWTHFFRPRVPGPDPVFYHQLDYVLVSRSLAQASGGVPDIIRKGLARRAALYTGPRFETVGLDKPVASDHCPVVFEVVL